MKMMMMMIFQALSVLPPPLLPLSLLGCDTCPSVPRDSGRLRATRLSIRFRQTALIPPYINSPTWNEMFLTDFLSDEADLCRRQKF